VFVGSGIFKSDDPAPRAKAIVEATTHFQDPAILARVAALVNAVSKKAAHDVLGDRPADLAGTRRR
jgi:pyridoxal 5'-phosphate synthase pdxS subunit